MNPVEFESALLRAATPLVPQRLNGAAGPWVVSLGSGDGTQARIDVGGAWASVQCCSDRADEKTSLDHLSAQAGRPGGVKLVGSRPWSAVRADIPLLAHSTAGNDWIVRQLRASLAGIRCATGSCHRAQRHADLANEKPDPDLLAYACASGGWTPIVKPDGSVRIEVTVRGMPRVVCLQTGGAGVRASVAFGAGSMRGMDPTCSAASAMFLIRASAALRWARAFAASEGGEHIAISTIGFECELGTPHDDQALLLAVDTLISACEFFGSETETLLEHPGLASRYLQLPCVAGHDHGRKAQATRAAATRAAFVPHAAHAAPALPPQEGAFHE